MSFKEQLASAKFAAVSAAQIIMEIYNNNTAEVTIKDDDSPVTQADIAADKLITNILKHHYPTYAFLTEESTCVTHVPKQLHILVLHPVTCFCIRRECKHLLSPTLSSDRCKQWRHTKPLLSIFPVDSLDK